MKLKNLVLDLGLVACMGLSGLGINQAEAAGVVRCSCCSGLEVQSQSSQASTEKQINYKTIDFSTDSDEVLMARMLFGEARNCSNEERAMIAYTAINRAEDGKKWNGESVREAILKPKQYSCFNSNDPNLAKLKDPEKYDVKAWKECLQLSKEILDSQFYKEVNKGQTHYFNPKVVLAKWAKNMKPVDSTGKKHKFYIEK